MKVFVTDFDGTMTRRDFYRVAQERLVPPDTPDYWEDYRAGRLTHFQALQAIFTRIRGSEEELIDAAREMELDPRAGVAVGRLQDAGWEVRVASAGCHWYIDRLLAEQNIHVMVYANPGAYDPRQGLLLSPPVESPYFTPATGIDKLAVVREALESAAEVAFAGDGPPDLAPALLVTPPRRFARGFLAEALEEKGESFRRFDRWSEIADMLLT
ncbi:MAG: HAD-IB family phosphatase [Armatimonadota bacterium]